MKPIIEVQNLSKLYQIGAKEAYGSLRDEIMQAITAPFRRLKPKTFNLTPDTDTDLWALKDVSFEVNEGEVVGIIGRNGAGKSTLLKILSRIAEPTSGKVTMRGRVASLLEVGTGFHPELTGRENIFLNGALLGMTNAEIKSKFDEIVAFSEIEKFLDTPVKRYSSGMYVRLAFAVAAHLEPEILIIDEVLAVGDAQFQKKCLGKMGEVAKGGRTVLFVSHNMGVIAELCNRGIVLSSGTVSFEGDVREAVSLYNGFSVNEQVSVENCARRGGSGGITIKDVWVTNSQNERTRFIVSADRISLNIKAMVSEKYQNNNIIAAFAIDTIEGQRLFTCMSSWVNKDIKTCGDVLTVKCVLPSIPFVPDRYLISASINYRGDTLDCAEHCEYFEIMPTNLSFSRGRERGHGYLDIPYEFEVVNV